MTGNRRDLADRIMSLAVSNPPAVRGEWADAMHAEFKALEKGRLSWSLGCLVAAARWWAAGEATYAAALGTGVVFVGALAPLCYFGAVLSGLLSRGEAARMVMPLIVVALVLAGFAIALNWPRRRLATALIVGLGPSLIGNALLAITGAGLRVPTLQMLVIWGVMVGLGYVGALAGAALGRRRAARIAR